MKRLYLIFSLLTILNVSSQSQNMGLSFNYFIPSDGDFAAPISPFSIRGVGFDLNNYFAVQTGLSLYRISGLGLLDVPFQDKSSLVGPNFTLLIPIEAVIQLKGKSFQFNIKSGGFFFYAFDQHLNYGNLDRAISNYQNWDITNSTFTFKNKPGLGVIFGFDFYFDITSKLEIGFGSSYLYGKSNIPLIGSYYGGNLGGDLNSISVEYKDAKVNFSGLEFSIGVAFKTTK